MKGLNCNMSFRKRFDFCPYCGASLIGDPIPQEVIDHYSESHYRREIGIYDREQDELIGYQCTDCDGRWPCGFVTPIVGLAEAAEILGLHKNTINTYIARGKFPEPIQRLASGPIWTKEQIEDYRDARK